MSRSVRWTRTMMVATGGALVLAGAVAGMRAVRAVRSEAAAFHPRRGAVERPRILDGVAGLRDVTFQGGDGVLLRGWYIPSANRAAIVLSHGSLADRSQMSAEARTLADAGFGVLAFDWPGHGESGGRVTCGRGERDALRAAVSFVASQPEIDPTRIGALGFSIGASLVATAAADDRRMRAIVLISPFADSIEQTRAEFAPQGAIAQWAALRVDRANMPDGALRPVDAVGAIGQDRSLLVVAAVDDPVVPLWMSEEVYTAAKADKELFVLPSGGHPDLDGVAAGPCGQHILQFFQRKLE